MLADGQGSFDQGRESDSKGPIGWIRSKYREAKESAEQRRAKSPPPADRPGLGASGFSPPPKSLDMNMDEQPASLAAIAAAPTVATTNAAPPLSTGSVGSQTATVTMVQPEPMSPTQQPQVETQASPIAQAQPAVQPAAQVQGQALSVQDQPQSPTQATMESPKPHTQKIRSMLDVDTPPVAAPLQSPTSPSAPTFMATQTQAQQEPELPAESKSHEKPADAMEQTAVASPVQLEHPHAEQQSKPEAGAEEPKQE
jgi:hypothetical protein